MAASTSRSSDLKKDINIIYNPNIIEIPIQSDIPAINYDSDKLAFTGSKSLDCFPTIIKGISVAKGKNKPWFEGKGLCVRLETYGGGGDISGDLACLFHSTGKSLLPELSHIPYNSKDKTSYEKECQRICQNFKSNIASFFLTDTNEDPILIKLRYTLSTPVNFNTFFEHFIVNANVGNIEDFRKECLTAITERNRLMAGEKELVSLRDRSMEKDGIKSRITEIREELRSPNLNYNRIRAKMERFYLDPRYRTVRESNEQYFWSPEIRSLPITMGLFTMMNVFEELEGDIREEEMRSNYIPGNGGINFTTLIDQLLSRKMYGMDFFRLITASTGFNIFMITPDGEPHRQRCVSPVSTDVDIVSLFLQKLADPGSIYNGKNYNENCPCIVITFITAHFESVALLHEIAVKDSKNKILQGQTVFSFKDPFIQALIRRGEEEDNKFKKKEKKPEEKSPSKKKESSEKVEEKKEASETEVDFENMDTDDVMTYLDKISEGNWRIGVEDARNYARNYKKERLTEKTKGKKKESSQKVKEKEVDFESMKTQDVIDYLDEMSDRQWRSGTKNINKYADNYRKERLAEKGKSKKKEPSKGVEQKKESSEKVVNFKNMDTDEVIKYLDKINHKIKGKDWKSNVENIRQYARNYKKEKLAEETNPFAIMDIDEAMDYLSIIDPEWKKMLPKGIKPRDYARKMIRDAKGE
jgi:hypothetical protein